MITVSDHAIDQYRNKMFDFSKSDEEISSILTEIIKKGTRVNNRPQACEIKYRELSVVAKLFGDKTVIVTFLGDDMYRAWYRRHKPTRKKKAS